MPEPVLYIVATPIGNLGDMSPRAVERLTKVDLIAAEDTRRSARLMAHFNINTRLISVHDHNERQQIDKLLAVLGEGKSLALISDAGTPLISDPGFALVRAVRAAGYTVLPIPGCSAFVAALSVSGLPTDRFVFEGFPPASSARRNYYQSLVHEERTLVFYESPHRILNSLADLQQAMGGDRQLLVARELTKTFETIYQADIDDVISWMKADHNQQKGEFVLVLAGHPKAIKDDMPEEALRILQLLLKELSVKKASALASEITGIKKNLLYKRALAESE